MKKIFVLLCYLSIVFVNPMNGIAQPPAGEGPMGPPPEMSRVLENSQEATICQIQIDWLKKKLKLDKSQLTAVEKSTSIYVKKVLSLKKTITDATSLETAKEQAIRERDQAMKLILSEKQYSRYLKTKPVLENSFEYVNYGGMPPPPVQ